MRTRVITVYLTLLVLAGVALAVPLCQAVAARATATLALDRANDAARFADLAVPAVVSGAPGVMTAELAAYHQVYGIEALVVDRDGGVVAGGVPGRTVTDLVGADAEDPQTVPAVLRAALAGNRSVPEDTVWPWRTEPLVVAHPVGSGGEVVGVVVTASPTSAVRRSTLTLWAGVWTGVLGLWALGFLAAAPLARWVLRPVADLEQVAVAISAGRLDARAPTADGPGELQRLAGSFNTMADTITELLDRQQAYVAFAGHQLRNPLAALRLRVESLGSHVPEASRAEHRLTLAEVDRLARTCEALLTLARSDDDRPDPEEVDVADVARERLAAWEPIAGRTGAHLVCEVPGGHLVRCAPGTLDQALDALLDNALKFGGAGTRVVVSCERVDDASGAVTVVRVTDDGPGLDEEQLRHAAEPWWQAHAPRRPGVDGGSGLGLSIVVTLLELDGGSLTLAANRPHGIVAEIRLPTAGPGPVRT